MDAGIDLIRAWSGTEAEKAMAIASLRRFWPTTKPFLPSPLISLSYAADDLIDMAQGRKSPVDFVVKTIPPTTSTQ